MRISFCCASPTGAVREDPLPHTASEPVAATPGACSEALSAEPAVTAAAPGGELTQGTHRSIGRLLSVKHIAKNFGTEDIKSCGAIFQALHATEGAGKIPVDASKVFLHRNTEARFLDNKKQLIFNNPNACAETEECIQSGINFLVSIKERQFNSYPGGVTIVCTLQDVLDLGGKVYSDVGAAVCNAVLVTMPNDIGLPFKLLEKPGEAEFIYDSDLDMFLPASSADPEQADLPRYRFVQGEYQPVGDSARGFVRSGAANLPL